MGDDFHQPTDKSYKFMHKRLGIKFHRYLYKKGESLRYIDTEIPETGQRRDITYIVDEETIFNMEFQSTPLYQEKMEDMFDYVESLRSDRNYGDFFVRAGSLNTYNPNHGIRRAKIKYNISFEPDMFFTQERDGWEVLSTSIYKVFNQEEFSDDEAIDLLVLPDMDINMSVKTLMKSICFLIVHANIPDKDFKNDVLICEMVVLKRFFNKKEWLEMVKMIRYESDNPERVAVIEKYGMGFDLIYFDGKLQSKIETAENLIVEGVDEGIISRSTGIPLKKIRELKRKL